MERRIEGEIKEELDSFILRCNEESGLHMQLVLDEPRAFDGFLARYGKFSGVRNYIAVVGKKSGDLAETCGYYGEKVVLHAQALGLNTCWVAMTYKKQPDACQIDEGEKLYLVIAVGYGRTQGVAHRSKAAQDVIASQPPFPDWFLRGVEAALLAPTALNQQKFAFSLRGKTVLAKPGMGFYSKIDLGIVKYHFEVGAGRENFTWE